MAYALGQAALFAYPGAEPWSWNPCDYWPFYNLFEACKVPTEAQIRAGQEAEFGPAMTPESRAAALQAADAAVAAYIRAHPEEAAEYQRGLTQQAAFLGLPLPAFVDTAPWLLYLALAAGGLAAARLLRLI